MAGRVRKPLTDEELAQEETELAVERELQDRIDLAAEAQQKLAAAGEPEAQSAVAALRAVARGNVVRLNLDQQEAISMAAGASVASGAPVEDERVEQAKRKHAQKRVLQAQFEESEARKELDDRSRARLLMKNHWQRWAREGDSNYHKACSSFRLNVGRDAVALVDGGVFDSHLDVAQFIQRMTPAVREAEQTDWTDDLDKELRELRGED